MVVHAHGGPSYGPPKTSRNDEDIKRWAITVKEGHAWAGSVFRQGGFAVTTAAEDTERVRRIFVDHVAKRDVPVVQACGLVFAAVYIGLNMIADIVSILSNPRLRHPK